MNDKSMNRRLPGVRPGALLLAFTALAAGTPMPARAEAPVAPPCNADLPQPPYAALGAAPNVQVWNQGSLPEFSARAACVGWPAPNFALLIALAGTFPANDAADLLSRFGAVSTTLGVRYWSTSDHAWRPLVTAAAALTKPVDGQPREDFTSAELATGLDAYLAQSDSRGAGEVIYRMRLREGKPDRLVIETENVTPVRWLAFTLLKPGSLRCVYFLERRSAGVWSYYSLTRIAERSWFISGHENSYVNRVVAQYRHIARIPTDLDPPFAP